ncbi:hypothetical protein STCU_10655 [Strigomonas culicis]|uniref:Uncharacterized protein n=1 Tax=Strigomonas culicis TaxID=28005 RepID=S9V3E8_9TRYP|nr:hypothetical protein STCU_10655 [Strigomonas culicis]|eukprot:EPY17380.1 hypothetical protein STCU_10655 [Strigomonas culicis]
MLVRLLQGIRGAPWLADDDRRMIDRAAEGGTEAFAEDEVRPFDESLLELLGDEAVTAQSPHFTRVMAAFAPLNVA